MIPVDEREDHNYDLSMSTPTSTVMTTRTTAESTAADHDKDVEIGVGCKSDPPLPCDSGGGGDANTVAPPFSVFTRGEKWALILMAAVAGFYSPLTANVYFPAIPLLSEDFGVSISLMNLTVTVYLIFQGISPMLWAPLADTKGRRPVYLICLSILSVTCIALALVPTSKWWLLLIFRCLQASGSASTIALGSGVVADIATPSERGGFLGFTLLGALMGPCIGPVIGGLLAGGLGWRWIFWFLCILSTVCLALMFLFFPETLRRIVGNGSQPAPSWWSRPLIPIIGPNRRRKHLQQQPTSSAATPQAKPALRSNPFLLFLEPDVMFMLLSAALTYCLFVTIQSTTSLLFQQAYPSSLNQMQIGLCFLPMGMGALLSSAFTGKQLDWEYKRCRGEWEEKRKAQWEDERREGGSEEKQRGSVEGDADPESPTLPPPTKEDELTFHVEAARLRWSFLYTALTVASCIGYGWSLDRRAHMAVPLAIQFVAGWAVVGQMNSFQTLLIDVLPGQGSSTTAINNFIRCLVGAGLISIINLIIDAIGAGWTYTLFSLIGAVAIPIFTLIVIRHGPRWRLRRWQKKNQK